MSVGLALIAKNEENNLPRLLESIEGAFDRVVLLDTGSTDDTVAIFQRWAKHQPSLTYSTKDFEWVHDFASARNAADNLLCFGGTEDPAPGMQSMVDWKCWADCDDVIVGASAIRQIVDEANPIVTAFICGYDYAQLPDTGQCVCHLKRERMVRVGASRWVGRVHEAQTIAGASTYVPDQYVHWKHVKQVDVENPDALARQSNERNLEILLRWVQDEPDNSRVLGYLGTEHAVRGEHDVALQWYERYLAADPQWDEERAQVHRKLSASLMVLDKPDEAEASALKALTVVPSWPDSYMTLAEIAYGRSEFSKAIEWSTRVQEIGTPDTLLIINPLEYTFAPLKLQAVAHGALSHWDEAVRCCEDGLAIYPDPHVHQLLLSYKAQAKREHTAQTYVMAGQQLVAHDEQLKALNLLEHCVPHFATDHQDVVALRSQVRERLLWLGADYADHYQTGGSKPEDFHGDEESDKIAAHLPRVKWLIEGLQVQMEEVAA